MLQSFYRLCFKKVFITFFHIFHCSGAAFQGIDISSCSSESVSYMQKNLRIIDPLYGALRPMDKIQPYRLEMASKGVLSKTEMGGSKTLAEWWKESVTSSIVEELDIRTEGQQTLLNLASDEYSAALKPSAFPNSYKYIKVVFQQDGRVIAVHAKRARGLMVRYVAENNISDLSTLKKFNVEGYEFVAKKSTEDRLVFDRSKQLAAQKGTKKTARSGDEQNRSKRVKRERT